SGRPGRSRLFSPVSALKALRMMRLLPGKSCRIGREYQAGDPARQAQPNELIEIFATRGMACGLLPWVDPYFDQVTIWICLLRPRNAAPLPRGCPYSRAPSA